jgi:hypothetical protein
LSDLFFSLSVLAPTSGVEGDSEKPVGGLTALSWPNSAGLFGLNGIDATRSFVAAAFLAGASPADAGDGFDGALAVLREAAFAAAAAGFEAFALFVFADRRADEDFDVAFFFAMCGTDE